MNFAEADPVLFVPVLEPRDHIPTGLRVREYPWGDLKCADPYGVLVSLVGEELARAQAKAERVGMNPSAARISLPIQAGEQIPLPEDFARLFSGLADRTDAQCRADFAKLYLRKTPEEIQVIRLANRMANVGLEAFFENLQPGVSESEVAAAVESAIY